MDGVTSGKSLIAAQEELEKRVEFALLGGQSYKSIMKNFDLSKNQVKHIRKKCGVSAWEFRNGNGPLGTVICARAKLAPMDNIKKLAGAIRALPPVE